MTVIAVKKNKTNIEIAGDSQVTWGHKKGISFPKNHAGVQEHGKLFETNGMTIGCAGKMANAALFSLFCNTHKPKSPNCESIMDWYIEFTDWIYKKAKVNLTDIDLSAIIVFEGKVFELHNWPNVTERDDFCAIGSGLFFAIGAMDMGASAYEAVKVAIKYDLYCGGEVHKIKIPL